MTHDCYMEKTPAERGAGVGFRLLRCLPLFIWERGVHLGEERLKLFEQISPIGGRKLFILVLADAITKASEDCHDEIGIEFLAKHMSGRCLVLGLGQRL